MTPEKWQNIFDPLLWRSSPHYPLLLPLINNDLTRYPDMTAMLNPENLVNPILEAKINNFGISNIKKAWSDPETSININFSPDFKKTTITISNPNINKPDLRLPLAAFLSLIRYPYPQALPLLYTLNPNSTVDRLEAYYLLKTIKFGQPAQFQFMNTTISQSLPKATTETSAPLQNPPESWWPSGDPEQRLTTWNKMPDHVRQNLIEKTQQQPNKPAKAAKKPKPTLPTTESNSSSPTAETETPNSPPETLYTPNDWTPEQRQLYWNSLTDEQKKEYTPSMDETIKKLQRHIVPLWYKHNPEARDNEGRTMSRSKQWQEVYRLVGSRAKAGYVESKRALFAALKKNISTIQIPDNYRKNLESHSLTQQQIKEYWADLSQPARDTWLNKQLDSKRV